MLLLPDQSTTPPSGRDGTKRRSAGREAPTGSQRDVPGDFLTREAAPAADRHPAQLAYEEAPTSLTQS